MYEKCPYFREYNCTCEKCINYVVEEEDTVLCLGTTCDAHWLNCSIFLNVRCKYLENASHYMSHFSCGAGGTIDTYELKRYCAEQCRECSYYKAKEAENKFDEENKDAGW